MMKVCKGFQSNLYPCPPSYEEREEMTEQLNERLEDLQQVHLIL